jgi:hypothetical protein
MAGKYKSGIQVQDKTPEVTKVQFAQAFATQLNWSLAINAQSLQQLDAEGEVSSELYGRIQDFFSLAITTSDMYSPSLRKLQAAHLKGLQTLKIASEDFEKLATPPLQQEPIVSIRLLSVLKELITDVLHFVQQVEMTYDSFTPGKKPNVRPVNWPLRLAVNSHIEEHQKTAGAGKYPNLNAAQTRAKKNEHVLSDRTYREIKKMHKNGTVFHYVQPRKR